jgi:hypothetical protein
MLTGGQKLRLINDLAPVVEEPTKELMHTVMAVSYGDVETALGTNLAGFVLVTNVDEEGKKVHMMTPCAGRLPNVVFLVSEIQSMDK